MRFRWTSGHASFFIPTDATTMTLPLKAVFPAAGGHPVSVAISVDDRWLATVELPEPSAWVRHSLPLPPPAGLPPLPGLTPPPGLPATADGNGSTTTAAGAADAHAEAEQLLVRQQAQSGIDQAQQLMTALIAAAARATAYANA